MSRVLITGCSSGFGFEAAKAFQSRGDQVFAGVRNLNGSGVARLVEAGATPVLLDVNDEVSVEGAIARILADGPLDALINNAGIFLNAVVEESSDAMAHRLFETNFFGPLRTIRAVLPSMRARKQGVIVNISSVAGITALPGGAIYSGTKFALTAMSEALYYEVKPFGIRVRIVEPGNFPTTQVMNNALASARAYGSPYQHHMDAFRAAIGAMSDPAAPAPNPDLVVEAMWRAVHEPDAPFQQPAGADCEALAAARRGVSFETFEERLRQATGWILDQTAS